MRGLKKLSDVLPEAFGSKEILRAARAQTVLREWDNVVGPLLCIHAKLDRYDHGTIWVIAKSSTWAQEVRLRSGEITRRLNEIAGEKDLFEKLRVGSKVSRGE